MNDHGFIDGLEHVVQGQAGRRHAGKRFHFNAGLSRGFNSRDYFESVLILVRSHIDFDASDRQRVAEWDKVCGSLGTHDTGEFRDRDRIAFLGVPSRGEGKSVG